MLRHSMKTRIATVLVIGLMTVSLGACSSRFAGSTVDSSGVGAVSRVVPGVIVAAQEVTIRDTSGQNIGATVGGVAGAVGGSALGGSNRTNILGGIGGAVLGALAGGIAGSQFTNETGVEYVIRMDDGQTVTVTQGVDPPLVPGQRVLIVYGRDRARVVADGAVG